MKISKWTTCLLAFVLFVLLSSVAYPCTTFILRNGKNIIFGRNLDWITGTGLIMTNPGNMQKVSIVDPSEQSITWTSKFGSVTFNQVGRDLPYGGINEAGLVVENMTLDETIYPAKDRRFALSACQWIQFQLDNFSKIEQVISSDTLLRIVDRNSKFHFLVCDKSGQAAVIEFLNGKMVCHSGTSLPVETLANSSYEKSLGSYINKTGIQADRSLYNFCTAASQSRQHSFTSPDSLISDAFAILNNVAQRPGTKWSIVYDVTNMRVYFRIFETPVIVGMNKIFTKQFDQAILKTVDFRDFDFNCIKGARVLDLNDSHEGDVHSYFTSYTTGINKEFIHRAFKFFSDWGVDIALNEEQLDYLAKYPESFQCMNH